MQCEATGAWLLSLGDMFSGSIRAVASVGTPSLPVAE